MSPFPTESDKPEMPSSEPVNSVETQYREPSPTGAGGLASIVRKARGEEVPTGASETIRTPIEPPIDRIADVPGPPPNLGGPVEAPSRRRLSPEIERELEEAMGDLEMERLIQGDTLQRATTGLEQNSRHRGSVVKVHGDNVFISLGGRHEGVASLRQFKEPPNPGDVIDVLITGRNREDGLYDVNIPGAAISATDWSDLQEGAIIEVRVNAANTGGLECVANGIRGFIPASQISTVRVENLGDYVGQKLVCVVAEVNQRRGKLVLSRRAIVEREKEEAKKKLREELAPGQTREGIVRSLREFGAFIDLGGVDGLLHISQLSWDRIKHPGEVLAEGQKITVRIEKIDPETGKISLAYKNEADHPWKDIEKRFAQGSSQKGIVSRIADFGAFVKLAPGVEGLIHVSELAHHRVYAVKNIVKEGQAVEVKILSIDQENQRMSLSMKALVEAPVKKEEAKVEEPEEEVRKPAVPRRDKPLKGGIRRAAGGEQFGLKW